MKRKIDKEMKIELILLGCLVAIILFFVICSSMKVTNECVSISLFGKWELKNVDCAVITIDGEKVTVTDENLLDELVSETRVADRVSACGESSRQIDLYSGDKLVRSMKWDACCNTVKVYEPGLTHWLISFKQSVNAGYVQISNELASQLEALFN